MDKAGASNAKQALAAFIDYYLSTAHLKAPERGCPIPALASDVAHMHKAARGSFSVGVTRLIEALTALFERAGVRNPRLQASATLAQLVGTLNLVRTIQEPARAQEMLDDLRDALREHLDLNS
jgi:TetR/AcrR family transcriptional repressor of nem operon